MSFEITIWKFVISFSIFREVTPQDIESAVFYKSMIGENGEILKIPINKPFL